MKTLELKLKKDVLIVDENDFYYYEIFKEGIYFRFENGDREFIEGEFFIFCKGSELTEESASELAFDGFNISENKKVYVDHYDECNCFESAIKSVISYVRIEGFHWLENTIKHPKDYEVFPDSLSLYAEQEKLHLEAEEKTFRNPLIFVKI